MDLENLKAYLAECRTLALAEIQELIPSDGRYREVLYDLALGRLLVRFTAFTRVRIGKDG